MPTIDELAPATSASDTDEMLVSQAGIARKITRMQVLNGVQTQISVPTASLLGRSSSGTGSPEVISVGANLVLSGGTLAAAASPFVVSILPSGTVPQTSDLLSLSQQGTNVAVTYGQFLSGISELTNIDLSQGLVTQLGSSLPETLGTILSSVLTLGGGTLTGGLSVAADPVTSMQVANKAYVDQVASGLLPLVGGSLSGVVLLSAPPQQPLQPATKGYVDSGLANTLGLTGGTLSGALTLNMDPVSSLQAATKHYADLKLSRSGDTLSGILLLSADPTSPAQAATKNYVDSAFGKALPLTGGTLLGALLLASDPALSGQAATKQYVDQRILRGGDTLTGFLSLLADPVSASHAATKNYVDTQALAAVSRAGGSMTGFLVLASDPSLPLHATTKQYVDLRVSRTGDTFTGALFLAASPTAPLQAATKQYVDIQVSSAVTQSGSSFVGPVILSGDPVMALQAATKEYVDARVQRSGDTLSGSLTLAADPISPGQAATKNYVDSKMSSVLPRSGGTLSGTLTLNSDPSAYNQAATKHYVDTQVSAALPLSGGSVAGPLLLGASPVSPLQAADKQYVDGQVLLALPLTGGSLTGTLVLAGQPTAPLHAVTKQYVDANPAATGVINVKLSPYNAVLNGVTDDTAAFIAAYLAAPAGSAIYVPFGTTVVQPPSNWGISLTKRVKWFIDGTTLPDGTELSSAIPTGGGPAAWTLPGFVVGSTPTGSVVSQAGSQATDFAVQQSAYIVGHSGGAAGYVSANSRVDTIIYNSPGNFIWSGIDRLLWAGVQTPTASSPAQHVGRYVQTIRGVVGSGSSGQPLPQPQLWAACLEYRDSTGLPSSSSAAGLTIEMDWFGNGLDDADCRAVQSLVIGQNNTSGAPVEVSSIIGVWLGTGSTGSAKTVFQVSVPFSNAVLDSTNATSLNSAPVVKLAAGQAIAFEATNTCRLVYDNATGCLRWNSGPLSFVVGKGITVGWQYVFSSSFAIPNYIAGNIIFLTGSGAYTMTLPAAATVAAGTGFTFTNTGTGTVSITPSGADSIDCGPITLRQNDRYHIVSDGWQNWREVFRTNAVAPRWTAPPVLPSYTVATLPSGLSAGAHAFATNGRKPLEGAGSGSGVMTFFDGNRWISCCSGSAVAA